jgi:hypothetical protein
VHIQIEAAHSPAAIVDLEDGDVRVPGGSRRGAELKIEQFRGGSEHARLYLRIREVRPHRLRIEVKRLSLELFVPVGAAGDAYLFGSRLALAYKVEDQRVFAARAVKAGLVELGQEGAHIGR